MAIKKHFRTIFLSDPHFGYAINRSDLFANFLSLHSCENLYLVGDIVDFWVLEKKWYLSLNDALALCEIFKKIKDGVKVFYVPGNHDAVLRPHIEDMRVEGVQFAQQLTYTSILGKRYLVIHGDKFDNEKPVWEILSHLGNHAYIASLYLNRWLGYVRDYLGLPPWSLSSYLKQNIKSVINYINKFEDHMIAYCKKENFDGAICGHIHSAAIRKMGELDYFNAGDWVESCTALVENVDGTFEIIHWNQMA